jgi:hypothetical protein
MATSASNYRRIPRGEIQPSLRDAFVLLMENPAL